MDSVLLKGIGSELTTIVMASDALMAYVVWFD